MVLTGVVALIAKGSLSVGYYAAFLSAAERFRGSLSQLLWAVHSTDVDLRYIRDLVAYLDLPEERRGGKALVGGQGGTNSTVQTAGLRGNISDAPEIRFQGVEFCYPGAAQPVLTGINLLLRPGGRIGGGVVGRVRHAVGPYF